MADPADSTAPLRSSATSAAPAGSGATATLGSRNDGDAGRAEGMRAAAP